MSDETQVVSSREIGIDTLVQSVEGEDLHKPVTVYEFSGGKTFKDKGEDSNLYKPFPPN